MKWVSRWYVKSSSSNREYTVSLADDEKTWGCSCPHWKFRRAICKHIKEVQREATNVRIDEFFTELEFSL
jgi:hypothetical protein